MTEMDTKRVSDMHGKCHEICSCCPLCVYSHGPVVPEVISQDLLRIQLQSLNLARDTAAFAVHQSDANSAGRIDLPPQSLGLGSSGLDLLLHEQYQRRLGLYFPMEIGSDHHIRSQIRHVLNILRLSARSEGDANHHT